MTKCGFLSAGIVFLAVLPVAPSTALSQENHCKVTPSRVDAFSFPDRHAWDLFISLNQPALKSGHTRGVPDCSAQFGAPNSTSTWETWRLARTEVFLPDGAEPPEWNDTSLPSGGVGETPGLEDTFHNIEKLAEAAFDPEDGIFQGFGGIGETRMNRSTYEFIKENCLWSKDGLQRYAAAALEGKKPQINLPVESVEVKAVWLEFTQKAIDEGAYKRYYTSEHDGKLYGLTSFHILTKDVPKWFWATFHHKDAPENEYELPDDYGPPAIVVGTVWENYVLGGTQIDFVDNVGRPNILSDHYIEFGFQRSSCITCHSQASGSPDDSSPPRQTVDVGTPDPGAFLKDGKLFYLPTDFLWSIPFRARAETAPPPARCEW